MPLLNNIHNGRKHRNKAKPPVLISFKLPHILFPSHQNSNIFESLWKSFWWNHRVRCDWDVGILVNFSAQMYMYCSRVSMLWTMQLFVLPSRFVLCWRRYVVSWNHGVLFASHPVQLSLDVSQTRLLPLEKRETDSKVISCSLRACSLIKVFYGEQVGGWEVMRSHA